MVTCAAARVVATAAFPSRDRGTFLRAKTQDLIVSADRIGSNLAAALTVHDPGSVREFLTALRAIPYVIHTCSYDPDGKVCAQVSRDAKSLED